MVVPSAIPDSSWKKNEGMKKKAVGTIEIIVLLSSVVIKVHGRYNVYPKNPKINQEFCEPLIQLHTTTSEKIALQTVRVCDSNCTESKPLNEIKATPWLPEESANEPQDADSRASKSDDHATTAANSVSSSFVLQELITDTTGKRFLSVKPARYKKVSMWNSTLS